MLHSLLLGLGRAGAGLHATVLHKARGAAEELFAPGPFVGCDPDPCARDMTQDISIVADVPAAARLIPPERTVVHVCVPPMERAAVLTQLAKHGFRRIIMEKPLATDMADLAVLRRLRVRHGLNIAVVAHWLDSRLTERLAEIVRNRALGAVRSISFVQHKPRFARSLATADSPRVDDPRAGNLKAGHPTAFDVEVPHALGVALHLAGTAELARAELTDMCCTESVCRDMGRAQLTLHHTNGVVSDIDSDLTSPIRERRITVECTAGQVTGHYPVSDQDEYAQITMGGQRQVFADDALTTFMMRAYRNFAGAGAGGEHGTFEPYCTVTRLTDMAKQRSARNMAPSTPQEV